MQWLKLPTWKVGDRGFDARSGIWVSKKLNVSTPFTRTFRIMCLEGSAISFISPSSRDSSGSV